MNLMRRSTSLGCLFAWAMLAAVPAYGHSGEHSVAARRAQEAAPACELHLKHWEELLVTFTATGSQTALRGAQAQARCLRQRLQAKALPSHTASPGSADMLLYLAAWTAQADHRFADARGWLDRFLARRPQSPEGLLLGAALSLVAGDAPQALAWCRRLRNVDLLLQLTCRAQALTVPTAAGYARQRDLLEPLNAPQGARLKQWSLSVLGDLAARAGKPAAAIAHYEEVLALGPSQRAQLALADLWLSQNRPEEALAVLEQTGYELPLAAQVKALVARKRLGAEPETVGEYPAIAATMQALLDQGEFSHGREMAEFYLRVEDNPRAALRAIEGALTQQREPEDLALWRETKLTVARLDHRAAAFAQRARLEAAAYTAHEAE